MTQVGIVVYRQATDKRSELYLRRLGENLLSPGSLCCRFLALDKNYINLFRPRVPESYSAIKYWVFFSAVYSVDAKIAFPFELEIGGSASV
ncbi:MAG: hypothetical protein CM1200mP40_21210 [Gammaproteobacteria bacterium]|nr:MAG: hypothetical protein CM1200mP40_21210 [Gammaproteobacteria bacterium]